MAEEALMPSSPLDASHLAEVGRAKHGVLIHAGALPQAELDHLQRAIAVVLESGSDAQRAEAHALLQHLASRAEIVSQAWGSANPSEFARALEVAEDGSQRGPGGVFVGLALLYRPARFGPYVKRWVAEHCRSMPIASWKGE